VLTMIWAKVLLLLVLAVFPMGAALFALRWISTIAIILSLGFWMLDPSWGAWVYVGICLNLIQWRTWQLHIQRLRMSAYVSSPAMAIQNSSSVKAAVGGGIGAVRSFAGGDIVGVALGVLIAAVLFGLQGLLFPNPSIISQACGYPFVSSEELARLLDKLDYPTLLKFNRQARRSGVSGPMLAAELMRVLEERER